MGSALGICIGASTIKAVAVDENYNILRKIIKNHESNPKKELKTVLKQINAEDYKYIAITGRKFKDLLNITAITEPEASEYALKKYLANKNDKFNALISLGSENFILYVLDEKGNIIKVQTGNKCASGTGEFFLQQIRRMSVKPDKAIELAKKSEPYSVSGRCSVFCKSDCTHALNKGIPIGRVCAGLGDMMAGKVIELLQHLKKENVIIVGGVTENSYVIKRLREKIKGLVIPENANVFEAIGAAVYALENKKEVKEEISVKEKENSFSNLPSLAGAKHLVEFKEHERGTARQGDECILGLDVGSTTTKAVLLRTKDNKILCSIYLRTNGDPVKASRECYKDIDKQLKNIRVKIIGLGVTGSGRKIAGL
ncbi:activase, partial [Candidatus Woesearchaeota archaeon]|nr:activase [Candidatus Woesearchaeota archaeon]